MRRLLCETRGPQPVALPQSLRGPQGPACAADHPPANPSANFAGRVAGQWLAAFRFLGHASEDPSFLEDFRSGLARAVTQHYAELERDGKRYGFLGGRVEKAGTSQAGPLWTNGFYDAENLYRLLLDTGDAPLGIPPVRPSQVLAAVARTLVELPEIEPEAAASSSGKGRRKVSEKDPWPRLLVYTWDGPRIGGRLTGLEAKDRDLYGPEKAGTAALLVRAGRLTGDRELLAAGERMVRFAIAASRGEGVPMGKLQGQYLSRLHAAVAGLAADGAESEKAP
jgi:hypothetical protein